VTIFGVVVSFLATWTAISLVVATVWVTTVLTARHIRPERWTDTDDQEFARLVHGEQGRGIL
jgi:hypothetical protein